MDRKAVFFDADGTLYDIREGVPESAREALIRLREKGHLAFLCTGRSRSFVLEDLESLPLDGMIAACGTYGEYQGERLFSEGPSPEEAWRSVEILRAHGMIPVLEGPEYMYYDKEEYNGDVDWFADLIGRQLGDRYRPIRGNEGRLRINKISTKVRPGSDPEGAFRELGDLYEAISHSEGMAGGTIELVPRGFSKATGIRDICKRLGISREATVVFGDSNNDLSMFRYAQVRVAMGNATEKIRELADYVTADIFDQGIAKGLAAIGLLD
jgi:Cof subfamily protein (haloacid dehalogenase superfamily)